MAMIELEGDDLVVRLSRWERVGAMRGDVRVPRESIDNVTDVDDAYATVKGFRAPGTGFPGRIMLGTWRRQGAKDFVAVYKHAPGVVIDLEGAPFARIIVTGSRPAGL